MRKLRADRMLGWAMVLASCSGGAKHAPSSAAEYAPPPPPAPMMEAQAVRADAAMEVEGEESAPQPVAAASGPAGTSVPVQAPAAAPAKPKPARMVHYNGFVRLKVTTPRETLTAAVRVGEAAGGYVETSSETAVTLRVPVGRVREVFAEVQKLGDVLARSLTAQDVTDAFTAMELRLSTLQASRDRLVALLARARTEHEKLSLLREIKRLTEEIDQLELRLATMAKLAAFSRLTVEAVPRQAHQAQAPDEIAAFRWIQDLSPFRRDVAFAGEAVELEAPDGFVVLDDSDHWVAESADGAVMVSSARDNEPRGDAAFWLEAIRGRMTNSFSSVVTETVGPYATAKMTDGGTPAYRYWVGVQVVGDELRLVEVYYPSPEHEQRHGAAVRAALTRGAS